MQWGISVLGCFCWKLGVLEAVGKPLAAAFLSHLEASWRFKVSVRLLLSSRRGTIDE